MSEPVQSAIGFSDSFLERYERDANTLVARIRCWNEKVAVVTFRDVLAVRDALAGDFSALVRGEAASKEFLESVIRRNFEEVPPFHPYQIYSFLNQDDQPSLEVVAAGCDIAITDRSAGCPPVKPS
jgi:hypothetical protein